MFYLLLVERGKKGKETAKGLFYPGGKCLAGCAAQDFPGCYVQLKVFLRVRP
jgi:hypothetical protein